MCYEMTKYGIGYTKRYNRTLTTYVLLKIVYRNKKKALCYVIKVIQ